jgi:hypothetical protein
MATVVWVDNKGGVKYEKSLQIIGPFSGVIKCTSKELVFSDLSTTQFAIVQVDKKNQAIDITEPDALLLGTSYPYPMSQPADKKGFFAMAVVTNPPPAMFELIRYRSK